MLLNFPVDELDGVPASLPVVVLNVAQAGLLLTLNVTLSPSGSAGGRLECVRLVGLGRSQRRAGNRRRLVRLTDRRSRRRSGRRSGRR